MEVYLHDIERSLRLDPEETRAIVAEVRGNLEDLIAHLKSQGLPPDEAEREALRRFDDAHGLATALRRAHRRAPLILQLAALLLVVAGVAGLMLGVDMLVTATDVGLHTDTVTLYTSGAALFGGLMSLLPWGADKVGIGGGLLLILAPSLIVLCGAVASLWAAKAVVLGQRRPRWRRVGAFMGMMALCDGALAAVIAGTLPNPQPIPIPGGAQLAAAGLCFRPPAHQPPLNPAVVAYRPPYLPPTARVVVDRLCADRAATYLQYHIPNPPHYGEPIPILYDNRSRNLFGLAAYPLIVCRPCADGGAPATNELRRLTPWRPVEEGFAQFAPLDSGVQRAIVTIGEGSQIVQIPVHLRPLRRVGGGAHPFIAVTARGVTVKLMRVLRGLSASLLDLTIDATRMVVPHKNRMATPAITLSDARGRGIALAAAPSLDRRGIGDADGCMVVEAGGGHCAPARLFAALPRGTRLTLTLRSVVIYPYTVGTQGYRQNLRRAHTLTGPWRIAFVMP